MRAILVLLMLIIAHHPSAAIAYKLVDSSLGETISESQIVAIGRVSSYTVDGFAARVIFRPRLVLKGEHKDEYEAIFITGNPEFSPKCCDVGALYIFYMQVDRHGVLRAYPGRFGITLVEGLDQ